VNLIDLAQRAIAARSAHPAGLLAATDFDVYLTEYARSH
jgi:hypothetical protein